MLKLFQSIFGLGETALKAGSYPEWLVQAAIERAVAGTDPRIGVLPGHQRRLRPAVLKAIDQVIALVDALPPPVEAAQAGYGADPILSALFASAQRMTRVLGADPSLADFLRTPEGGGAEPIHALLMAERREHRILGMELQGDAVRRDVAQVSVSFDNHRLRDPSADAEGHRKLLRRRAFDHLLEIALGRIAATRQERADLARERDLLRRKLKALAAGGWGFETGPSETPADPGVLEDRVADIEAQLKALGGDAGTLTAHLDILAEVLETADRQLAIHPLTLVLDPMGIQRRPGDADARELRLQEIRSAGGRTAVVLPIRIPRGELPAPADLIAEAGRFLF